MPAHGCHRVSIFRRTRSFVGDETEIGEPGVRLRAGVVGIGCDGQAAQRAGKIAEGALEILNEAAFERCGAPLLEGDEIIEIDPDILEELLA